MYKYCSVLSIILSVDFWTVFSLGLLWIQLPPGFLCLSLMDMYMISLGCAHLGVGLLSHGADACVSLGTVDAGGWGPFVAAAVLWVEVCPAALLASVHRGAMAYLPLVTTDKHIARHCPRPEGSTVVCSGEPLL